MARNYTVQTKIQRPVADVFNAIISADLLCEYFTDRASADLEEGAEVRWAWNHFHTELPVVAKEIVRDKLIQLTLNSKAWEKTAHDSYDVSVIFEFEALDDGGTLLSISEQGWRADADGLKASHDNCSGWTHMAMCLKSWVEHGIDLR